MLDKPDAWTLVTVGAQARDTPNVWRSVPENDTTEVASLLLQAPVFLLSAGAQVRDGREGTRRSLLCRPRGRAALVTYNLCPAKQLLN